jgi:putative ABC transport system permease protein
MGHYCRSRYDLVAILKTLGPGGRNCVLIIGQWLMVLMLSAVTGGVMGLVFEKLLMVLLKPVLPAALPPASLWPWLWAMGAMTVISLLVGLRPYRLLIATQPLRVLRRCGGERLAAEILPSRDHRSGGWAAGLVDGGSTLLWAVLAGAVVLALLCGVLGWVLLRLLKGAR